MDRLDKLIWRVVDGAILLAVTGMVILIGLQVSSRMVGSSVPWTEELSRFLFIWTVWLGLAASFRAGTHPAIDLVSTLTSGRLRQVLGFLPAIATTVLFATVTFYGYKLLSQQIVFGETSPILRVGMYWATLPLVLGSALSIVGVMIEAFRGHEQAEDHLDAVTRHDGDRT